MPWLDGGARIRARASTAGGPRGEGASREREAHSRDGNNGNVELPHLACPFILGTPATDSRRLQERCCRDLNPAAARVPQQRYAVGEGNGCKLRNDSALMSKEF